MQFYGQNWISLKLNLSYLNPYFANVYEIKRG